MSQSLRAKAKSAHSNGKMRPFKPFLGSWTSFGYYLSTPQKAYWSIALFVVAYAVMVLFDTMLGALGILSGLWFIWNGRDGSFTEHEKKWFLTIAGATFYFIVTKLWGAYVWVILYVVLLVLVWRGDTLRGFRVGGVKGAIARVVRGGFRGAARGNQKRAARFMVRTMLFQTTVALALVVVSMPTALAQDGSCTTDPTCNGHGFLYRDHDKPVCAGLDGRVSPFCRFLTGARNLFTLEPIEAVEGDLTTNDVALAPALPPAEQYGPFLPTVQDPETGTTSFSVPLALASDRCEDQGSCAFNDPSPRFSAKELCALPSAPKTCKALAPLAMWDRMLGFLGMPRTPYSTLTFDGVAEDYAPIVDTVVAGVTRGDTPRLAVARAENHVPEVSIDRLRVAGDEVRADASATDEDSNLRRVSIIIEYKSGNAWVKLGAKSDAASGASGSIDFDVDIRAPGTYRVTATAKDNLGALATAVEEIDVLPEEVTASSAINLEIGVTPGTGVAGVTDFTFTAKATASGDAGRILYVFDYGDVDDKTFTAMGESGVPVTATFRYGVANQTVVYAPKVTAYAGATGVTKSFPTLSVAGNLNGTGSTGDTGKTTAAKMAENKGALWAGIGLAAVAVVLWVLVKQGAFKPGGSMSRLMERLGGAASRAKGKLTQERAPPAEAWGQRLGVEPAHAPPPPPAYAPPPYDYYDPYAGPPPDAYRDEGAFGGGQPGGRARRRRGGKK